MVARKRDRILCLLAIFTVYQYAEYTSLKLKVEKLMEMHGHTDEKMITFQQACATKFTDYKLEICEGKKRDKHFAYERQALPVACKSSSKPTWSAFNFIADYRVFKKNVFPRTRFL